MKKILTWATLILVLVSINFLIYQKEQTLKNGQTILLKLAPVDPRSLMQGDYMVLRYAMTRSISNQMLPNNDGKIVVTLDKNNVATFKRFDKGGSLSSNEHLLAFKNRDGLRLGAESFFFQEGDAKIYEVAQYGELKVDIFGKSVLVGLRGEDFQPLLKTDTP